MSDIKLFNINNSKVTELEGRSVTIEKSLQNLIEKHLDVFLGIKFLETEYSTGEKHKGRIDTLGIDQNNCPVIIEYKRATNENIINQGLYYLDWLMDHKAEYQLLVLNKCGKQISDTIEWKSARLICIAGGFTKYDTYAVQQINRNIELIRYKKFGNLILFDLVNAVSEEKPIKKDTASPRSTKSKSPPSVAEYFEKCNQELKDIYDSMKEYLLNLGDDVQLKILERYFAFKKIKNFVTMKFQPKTNTIVVWLQIDPKTVRLEKGFSKDVSKIGHHGTGDVELRIKTFEDLEKAKPLLEKSYELN